MTLDHQMRFAIATPDDAETVRQIVRAAYARWVPVIGREPLPMVVDYAQAIKIHRVEVLMHADETVGVLEAIPRDDHLWIENIAVRPDHQGAGFGRCLLARAEEMAAQMSLTNLRLLTNAAFESNITLYEKMGYTTIRTEPFRGGTTIYMSKKLKP